MPFGILLPHTASVMAVYTRADMNRKVATLVVALLLAGCAASRTPTLPEPAVPAQWWAPTLAHQGQSAQLATWWSGLGDPVLTEWIARAQTHSPSVAAARARIAAARAAVAATEVANGPQAAVVVNGSRGQPDTTAPLATTLGLGLQAAWVIDLWGQSAAEGASAIAQQQAAEAGWHEARVLVAAELARVYVGQRLCQAQLAVARTDRDSRATTASSSAVTERAGLTAPAVRALAEAGHAEAQARAQAQAERCERQIKALVALTDLPEPVVRAALPPGWTPPAQLDLAVPAVPADALRQRPDVVRAERELVAAAEAAGAAQAALLPSLQLSGSVLRQVRSGAGGRTAFNTWSIGPLTLTLPLVGRDALTGNADAAQAAYESAAVAYAATLRQAVAEVEQALVTLSGLAQRQTATDTAAAGYGQSLRGTEARHRVGLANLPELEEARRLRLNAESSALALQQERFDAWVALYLALGGGFDPAHTAPETRATP